MSDYADRKVKDVLARSGANAKLAEQGVRELATRDPHFLLELVQPFLGGIIAHAIERARKNGPVAPSVPPVQPLPKKAMQKSQPPADLAHASLDNLMKNWAKKFETPDGQKEAGVSQNHINAMQALVRKSYGKKD